MNTHRVAPALVATAAFVLPLALGPWAVMAPAGVAAADAVTAAVVEQDTQHDDPTVGHMPPTTYKGGMSDATGKKVIEAEAKRLGVTVTWKHLNVAAGEYAVGTNKIVIDPDARRMKEADAKTLVRHEVAHYRIAKTCGRVNPPIVGKRFENVADAYAHLYVGALSYRGYGWTAADQAIAAKLKAGTCMSGQTTKTVSWAGKKFSGVNGSGSYTVARGAKMTIIGPTSGGNVLVRDAAGRTGYLDPVSWAKATSTVTVASTGQVFTTVAGGKYTLARGARLSVLGNWGSGSALVGDAQGRLGHVSKDAWAAVTKTLTVKVANHTVFTTGAASAGKTVAGASYGLVRSWDGNYHLMRDGAGNLRLVPKKAF
ncbi:hypothetical protein Xcel_2830 [Xylanimonas cellulosilytica DSM 15894]|uniref:Peptidase M48 domain-containing protein n=1 Tax=Xylanimonas cellulosilytica (strain DSM 15894 / JCM 12276 / CECT 5975 / KCTC 9989 / LMG 20990 / NBRC 107835 / XIL07) TaxID=446471 RepID=D1BYH2_XYLCX|nr:hypothetical protein [Xylanimonas cellulosilytica]ACZ31844.1 hypothetical protein Xcel_2830 [Xylanimonas cellulosilytica DSM 15894]